MATENVRRQVGLVQVLTEKPQDESIFQITYINVDFFWTNSLPFLLDEPWEISDSPFVTADQYPEPQNHFEPLHHLNEALCPFLSSDSEQPTLF